jgi:MoxR-like ATPase
MGPENRRISSKLLPPQTQLALYSGQPRWSRQSYRLFGQDAIVIEDRKQVTRYREGILPWAYENPVALVFDEYDAGRPDVMFVIQRVLEAEGRLTILDLATEKAVVSSDTQTD